MGTVVMLVMALCATAARAAFPGANGKIAYLALTTDVSDPPAAHLQVWTINPNGTGATQLTHDDTGNIDHPEFSPDGSKIAYEGNGGQVYVMNADGSSPVDLTLNGGADITYDRPAWSPDGTKLAVLYRNEQDTTPEYDVGVISATTPIAANAPAGTGVTNLTAGVAVDSGDPSSGGGPAWSPDGTKIAFVRVVSGNPRQVWVMNANGTNPHAITDVTEDADNVAWAPDSSKIIFDSGGVLYTTNPSAISAGQTALTNSLPQANSAADYSPDGSKIVELAVPTSTGTTTISILNAAGTTSTPVTTGPSVFGAHLVDQPSWQATVPANLTVTKAGSGGGTVSSAPTGISCPGTCSFPYGPGTTVTLTASPSAGSYFAGWSGGGCSGAATTCKITLAGDTTVTATFNTGYLLTVRPDQSLGMEIKSTPAGIDCRQGSDGTCSAVFPPGAWVTLSQVTTQNGALFTGWSGAGCGGVGNCVVVMTGPTTVTGLWTYIAPHQQGTQVDAPLAFSAPTYGAYVGTEWTGYLTAVDCINSNLCLTSGYMTDSATIAHKGIIGTNPYFGYNGYWNQGVPDSDFNWAPPGDEWQLQDVSCDGTTFCGAVDDQGDVFTTTNPAKGADTFGPNPQGVWQKTQNLDPIGNYSYHQTEGIACPADGKCAVIDADGGLLSSSNTAGGAGTWSRQDLASQGSPTSISCPGPATCYVATATGDVLKSITSSAGTTSAVGGPWTPMAISPGNELDHLYCFQGDCFASDLSGNLWSSSHPDGGPSAWSHVNLGSIYITGISCTSTTFCVVVDSNGDLFVSKNPLGSAAGWTHTTLDHHDGFDGVSCSAALLHNVGQQTWCVLISFDGQLMQGSLPVLGVSRPGTGSGTVTSSTTINCGSTCSTAVPAGTTVTLTATPDANSAFSTWSSDCVSSASAPLTCTVKLDQPGNTQVAAVFSKPAVTPSGGLTLGGGTGTTTMKCTSKATCSGTVLITASGVKLAQVAKASAKATVIGKGNFRIKPHKTGRVRIHLTAAGKKLAKKHKLHSVQLTITTAQPHHKRLISVRTVTVRY